MLQKSLTTTYILEHFDQKTYRGDKTYVYSTIMNVAEVASADRGAVEEIKKKQRVSGFNSIFAVASVPMAKLYYEEFKKQMAADPTKKLSIATIFSYGANEEESDGILVRIHQHLIRLLVISWKTLSKIIMKCFIRIMIHQVISSKIIIKMYPFV